MYRFFSKILIICMFLFFLSGLILAVFNPTDIAVYENRPAHQLQELTIGNYADGTFQASMDLALADQLPFSSYCKKLHNLIGSHYTLWLLQPLSERYAEHYLRCENIKMFNGYLCYGPLDEEAYNANIRANAAVFNRVVRENPELDFYLYPIENEKHIDFETLAKSSCIDSIFRYFDCAPDKRAHFSVDSFEAYRTHFYRGDHHWNHEGSYHGYRQILQLLLPDEAPLAVEDCVKLPSRFTGLTALFSTLDSFSEDFYANIYRMPVLYYQVNGQPADSLNMRNAFLDGSAHSKLSYSSFYGTDFSEAIIRCDNPDGKNLLVIGDSYDNAILELLASHFKSLYAVDLRYYPAFAGHAFDLSSYVSENDIHAVLITGSVEEVFGSVNFILES